MRSALCAMRLLIMYYLDILPLASSLFCAAIALFVFFRQRWQPGAMAFSLGMAFLAAMEFANFLSVLLEIRIYRQKIHPLTIRGNLFQHFI